MNIFSLVLAASLAAAGGKSEKHKHREHGAHEHGHAKFALVIDGTQGALQIDSPGINIVGFEHMAKSAADKAKQAEALKKFETSLDKMMVFQKELECIWSKKELEVKNDGGGHSDIEGAFALNCKKSPLGSKVELRIQEYFPAMKEVQFQVLAGTVQKSLDVEKSPTSFELK